VEFFVFIFACSYGKLKDRKLAEQLQDKTFPKPKQLFPRTLENGNRSSRMI